MAACNPYRLRRGAHGGAPGDGVESRTVGLASGLHEEIQVLIKGLMVLGKEHTGRKGFRPYLEKYDAWPILGQARRYSLRLWFIDLPIIGLMPTLLPGQNLVYRVHPLHESLVDHVMDYGSLPPDTERLYIEAMLKDRLRDGSCVTEAGAVRLDVPYSH